MVYWKFYISATTLNVLRFYPKGYEKASPLTTGEDSASPLTGDLLRISVTEGICNFHIWHVPSPEPRKIEIMESYVHWKIGTIIAPE